MFDKEFERDGRAHAAWGAELKQFVRGPHVNVHRTFRVEKRRPCPTCGVECQVSEATDAFTPTIRFFPVDREHLTECERAIIEVRELLLDSALIGDALYDEHLGPCVGSPLCVAGLARDVKVLMQALKRENEQFRVR